MSLGQRRLRRPGRGGAAAYNQGTILVAASGNVSPSNFFELLFGCRSAPGGVLRGVRHNLHRPE